MTRAEVETILVSRLKDLLTAAGMSTSVDGANSDLDDAIAWAGRNYDGTDDNYLDLAEHRALKTIHNRLAALVDVTAGPRSEKLSQMAERVGAMVSGGGVPGYGYIQLDFVE